ncbi:hypothetical protein QQF64_016699 [Cirrhinus molitorella]|uniref:Uncharacterized protein n=1 Tax=Cirrhinus molitorella TaxID=172907 RepID=A0ABR3LQ75_9TELE
MSTAASDGESVVSGEDVSGSGRSSRRSSVPDTDPEMMAMLSRAAGKTGLFGDAVENFAQQFSAAQKQSEAIKHILPRRAAAASTRPPAAAPQSARRRGRPPASASAPPQPPQQPSQRRRGAGRRAAPQPVQAPTRTSGKRKSKRP